MPDECTSPWARRYSHSVLYPRWAQRATSFNQNRPSNYPLSAISLSRCGEAQIFHLHQLLSSLFTWQCCFCKERHVSTLCRRLAVCREEICTDSSTSHRKPPLHNSSRQQTNQRRDCPWTFPIPFSKKASTPAPARDSPLLAVAAWIITR